MDKGFSPNNGEYAMQLGTPTKDNNGDWSAPQIVQDTNSAPGVQGWIAAAGVGTASQDNALTFPNQVRKVALFNASAAAVPLEFDQTAAADSWPLMPNQGLIVDNVLCTKIHVFPSATLPINTTSGLYAKGWK